MPAWNTVQEAELRRLWDIHGGHFRKIAKAMGRTKGSIDGKSRTMGLQFHATGGGRTIDKSHPAYINGTTVFQRRIYTVTRNTTLLKSGDNQRKLGKVVTKGKWKGFPIYSLTLVERETCPRSCDLFLNCMGNAMGHAKRYKYGTELIAKLGLELGQLQCDHRGGFVVRLHILGDFGTLKYFRFWESALDFFPALHIFGYSHWQQGTVIGDAIHQLREARWDRFAVRTSDAKSGPRALTIKSASDDSTAVICPAQLSGGRGLSCGKCHLCWAPTFKDRAIAFLEH